MTRAPSLTEALKADVKTAFAIDGVLSAHLKDEAAEERQLVFDSKTRIKVGAAVPAISLADVNANARAMLAQMNEAEALGCDLLLFSDLALTGATCGVLFSRETLLDAVRFQLAALARATKSSAILTVLTAPFRVGPHVVKAAVFLWKGRVLRAVPLRPFGTSARAVFADPADLRPADVRHLCRELSAAALYDDASARQDEKEPSNEPLRPLAGLRAFQDGFEVEMPPEVDEGRPASGVPAFSDGDPFYPDTALDGWQAALGERALHLPERAATLSVDHPLCLPAKNLLPVRLGADVPLFLIPDSQPEWTAAGTATLQLFKTFSRREGAFVVYAGAGSGESTGESVFGGRRFIVGDGRVLSEGKPFTTGITVAVLDLRDGSSPVAEDRREEDDNFPSRPLFAFDDPAKDAFPAPDDVFSTRPGTPFRETYFLKARAPSLRHSRFPFFDALGVDGRTLVTETLAIQARGLAGRLDTIGARPVIGLSGGLDSAVAFLACLEATAMLGRDPSFVVACSMPGFGTSETSTRLSETLAVSAGVDFRVIPIHEETASHLRAIGHDGVTEDITFENAQARERTQILMDLANMENGLVVGTGDLSETALGWCTYNGDQMSMYAVNATLPKTVIRRMTEEAAAMLDEGVLFSTLPAEKARAIAEALREILGRPVSPELLSPNQDGTLRQITEDVVGPYELVDFFLWHFVFMNEKPVDLAALAEEVFRGTYTREDIHQRLRSFLRRFFRSQFKRKASPDGVACFPWQLLPQKNWDMPSDVAPTLWLDELDR